MPSRAPRDFRRLVAREYARTRERRAQLPGRLSNDAVKSFQYFPVTLKNLGDACCRDHMTSIVVANQLNYIWNSSDFCLPLLFELEAITYRRILEAISCHCGNLLLPVKR